MPTYHARGVSARLGTLPLSDAITRNIVARKGETARQQSEAAEKKLRHSTLLTEQSVPFPGDDDGFELNWLGNAPFMQAQTAQANMMAVHAGKRDRGDKVDNYCKPEALVLHIQLSDKTFVSGLDKAKTSLKIDVLFNGELTSCVFIPMHDIRSGAKSLHQVFAGTRVDYLSERPWVIMRTVPTTNSSARDLAVALPVEQRWQDICQALQREAQARGMDRNGKISPSTEFLEALAATHMPRQVHDMQRPGGMHFGVVDVIITAGDGRKTTSGAGYLKAPQRLIDDNFPFNTGSSSTDKEAQTLGVRSSSFITPGLVPDDVDAAGESEPDPEPQAKRLALTPRVLSMDPMHVISSPLSSLPTPSLPPPARSSLTRSPPSLAGRETDQRSPPPFEPKQGHIKYFEPPRRRYTHDEVPKNRGQGQRRTGAELQGEPHSVQPQFVVSGPRSTSPLKSSPWSYWGNGPMPQQPPFANSAGVVPFSNDTRSSPLQHFGPNLNRPHQILSSSPSVCGHDFRLHGSRYANSVCQMPDEHDCHNSSGSDRFGPLPSHEFTPQSRLEDFTTAPVAPMLPWDMPTGLPQTQNSMAHYAPTFPVSLPFFPFDSPMTSASMPPTGLYSMPAKPKTNFSLTKSQGLERSIKSCQKILVTRFVVYGLNGPIIDQRWAVPQFVIQKSGGSTVGGRNLDGSLNGAHKPVNERLRATEKMTSILPPEQLGQTDRMSSTLASQISAPKVHIISMKDLGRKEQDSEPRTDPLRLATSGNGILGIQGPNATTFWLDDPEEILRGPSRQRPSTSPAKRKGKHVKPIQSKVPPSTQSSLLVETTTSSSLSSVPTTPELVSGYVAHTSVQPILQLSQLSESSVPQAEGPIESAVIPPSLLLPTTPPPSEGLISTVSQQPDFLHLDPVASQSLNSKKRKASTQSVTKKWCSHDRVIEVNDNPLNQSCVITYADITTTGASTVPLRQVKSERQGVFQEAYVVFATRLFVPGN